MLLRITLVGKERSQGTHPALKRPRLQIPSVTSVSRHLSYTCTINSVCVWGTHSGLQCLVYKRKTDKRVRKKIKQNKKTLQSNL